MEIAGYMAMFFVGLILGTIGGGGSILSVPILVYLFYMDPVIASAYSLFIVGISGVVGSFLKFNAKMVSPRIGLMFGIPSIIGIFSVRKWLIPSIPDVILQSGTLLLTKRGMILGIFSILMILASLALISKKNSPEIAKGQSPAFILMLLGLLTGFLTGLVGAGGGFLIIPLLIYLTGMPFSKAVGTTLLIVGANSLIGFAGDAFNYALRWHFLFVITGLAIAGIFIGSKITEKLPVSNLKAFFGWFTLIIGTAILIREGSVLFAN